MGVLVFMSVVLVVRVKMRWKELEEKAYALGANAIVGVEVNYTTVGTKSMFMVIASGTAVVVR